MVMKPFEQRGTTILRRVPKGGTFAEIGVLLAATSEFVLRRRPDLRAILVDNWAPMEIQPESYRATRDIHALHGAARVAAHEREARMRVRPFRDRVQIIKARSVEAAATLEDASLDCVFIDADHSYEGCLADIRAWAPKVRPGGWIGGHDYRNPDPAFSFGVDRAVEEWAAETGRAIATDLNFTWWTVA